MLFLSLNSGESTSTLLENLEAIRSKGLFLIDDDLVERIKTTQDCIGVLISKHEVTKEMTATLTSWDCSRKTSLICSIESSQFTAPQKLVKFPCLPQRNRSRVKRLSAEEDIFPEEEYKASKFWIYYSGYTYF